MKSFLIKLLPVTGVLLLCALINEYFRWINIQYTVEYYSKNWLSIRSPEFLIILLSSIFLSWRNRHVLKVALPFSLQLLYLIPLGLLTWFYMVQPYNFYYENWFLADRILLLVLAAISAKHPLYLGPWLILMMLINHQYDFPLGYHPMPDKRLSIQFIVFAFSAFFFLRISQFWSKGRELLMENGFNFLFSFLALYIFIAYYFFAGAYKIYISPTGTEWIFENEVVNNMTAMMNRGWLQVLGVDVQNFLKETAVDGRIAIQVFVVLVEISAVLLMVGRRWALSIIPLLIVMHILIFLGNGGFFIHWILIGCLLLLLIWYKKLDIGIWTRKSYLMMLFLLPLAPVLVSPVMLGWFDSRVDSYFEIRVKKGETSQVLNPIFLRPYTTHLLVSDLRFVSEQRTLSPGFVTTSFEHLSYLKEQSDSAKVMDYIQKNGVSRYDAERAMEIRHFLRKAKKYLVDGSPGSLDFMTGPYYMNAAATGERIEIPIRKEDTIQLVQVFTYMEEGKTKVLKEVLVVD